MLDRGKDLLFVKSWKRVALCFFGGLLLALGHAPFNFPYSLFLVLPVLVSLVLKAENAKSGFLIGWSFGVAYFGLSLSWVMEPFWIEPEIFGWMAPFALFFLSAGLALFWAMPFAVSVMFKCEARLKTLVIIVLWSLSEFLRSVIFTGFPWGLIGYVWIETPVIQAASFIGIHGLGLLTLLVACTPVLMSKSIPAGVIGTLILFSLGWGVNYSRIPVETGKDISSPIVRLIQPNAAQNLKWRPDMVPVFFERQLELMSSKAGTVPDVMILPETAVAYSLNDKNGALRQISDAAGASEVIGGFYRRANGGTYNSLFLATKNGGIKATYDKQHLVPFGEYIPFVDQLRKFGVRGLADIQGSGFLKGTTPAIIQTSTAGRFLPMICYEAIFPGMAKIRHERPDWILHITNDAWFGDFSGPYQHFSQVRVRAIEQGLPVVRSANTGISAVIDPYGRIISSIELGVAGYLDAHIPLALKPTLYARWGDSLYFLGCFLILLATFGAIRISTYR